MGVAKHVPTLEEDVAQISSDDEEHDPTAASSSAPAPPLPTPSSAPPTGAPSAQPTGAKFASHDIRTGIFTFRGTADDYVRQTSKGTFTIRGLLGEAQRVFGADAGFDSGNEIAFAGLEFALDGLVTHASGLVLAVTFDLALDIRHGNLFRS